MDAQSQDKLWRIMSGRFRRMAVPKFFLASFIALSSTGVLLIGGCQQDTATNEPNTALSPETNVPEAPPIEDSASEPLPNTVPPKESSTPTAETVTEAPDNTASVQSSATLPDTLTRQWEPASNVLFTFGAMTITPDQVQWSSGQSSPYTVVSTDGGYLLQLESNPTFYETQNPYIKIIPKTDETGGTTSVDVAFYESTAKAESDDYIMYGSYFVE